MNRFTEALDAIEPLNDYIPWLWMDKILPKEKFSNPLLECLPSDNDSERAAIKALFLSLIANMSDEDLKECFDI